MPIAEKWRCPKCSMINPIPLSSADAVPLPEVTAEIPRVASEKSPIPYLPLNDDRWLMRGVDGAVYGPVRREELDRWYNEGRINYQCAVQRLGETEWHSAPDVLAAARHVNPASKDTGVYTYAPRTSSGSFRPHNGTAIIVLACIGTLFFPCAIAAAIMGHGELKRIKRGEVDPSGESTVRAGYILGLIFSVLAILPLTCCCLPSLMPLRRF